MSCVDSTLPASGCTLGVDVRSQHDLVSHPPALVVVEPLHSDDIRRVRRTDRHARHNVHLSS
jgi:hypothetical protein